MALVYGSAVSQGDRADWDVREQLAGGVLFRDFRRGADFLSFSLLVCLTEAKHV